MQIGAWHLTRVSFSVARTGENAIPSPADLPSPKPESLHPNVSAAVNGVTLVGTLSDQLFFGWLGDKLGSG
ncbi:hypothetical protein HanIR_Chr11g0517741 [Helianthus annuus]|nr:hypothetical protein HanIR_Chr11g0517741 [Helianthus annuus]